MASNNFKKESIVGFVSEISGEKRGPAKHYRRFNLITSDKEILAGWIFGEMSIEETSAGKILLRALQTKKAVRVHGTINNEQGGNRSIKVWIRNRQEKSIELIEENSGLSDTAPAPVSTECSVMDALESLTPCEIQVYVVTKNETVDYVYDNKQKKHCTLVVGDTSGTTILVVYDEMVDMVEHNQTWTFTQVKTKKIRDDIVLTTSTMTTCTLSKKEIEPNLDRLNDTLKINLLDEEKILTCIDEIADVKKGTNCTTCHQLMSPVEGKEHLLCCKNCSKYTLTKRCDLEASISFTIENQKMVFWTAKGVLNKLLEDKSTESNDPFQDLCEEILSKGPWHVTVSNFRRQITEIRQP